MEASLSCKFVSLGLNEFFFFFYMKLWWRKCLGMFVGALSQNWKKGSAFCYRLFLFGLPFYVLDWLTKMPFLGPTNIPLTPLFSVVKVKKQKSIIWQFPPIFPAAITEMRITDPFFHWKLGVGSVGILVNVNRGIVGSPWFRWEWVRWRKDRADCGFGRFASSCYG